MLAITTGGEEGLLSFNFLPARCVLTFSRSLQRVTDENGNVISQLCDDDNSLGSKEFEQAMRKQAVIAELICFYGGIKGYVSGTKGGLEKKEVKT